MRINVAGLERERVISAFCSVARDMNHQRGRLQRPASESDILRIASSLRYTPGIFGVAGVGIVDIEYLPEGNIVNVSGFQREYGADAVRRAMQALRS